MGTPSEVLAAGILETLFQPDELKYVDTSYDFYGMKRGRRLIFEVKSRMLTPPQMLRLAKEKDQGADVYLIHVNLAGDYLLFKLVATNLSQTHTMVEEDKEAKEMAVVRVRVGHDKAVLITPGKPSVSIELPSEDPLAFIKGLIELKTKKKEG